MATDVRDLAVLPLHDATLLALHLDWGGGGCTADLRGSVEPMRGAACLVWRGVTSVQVERSAPWGPSASVLEARGGPSGRFEIVMQSGDRIRVEAAQCALEIGEAAV